MSLTSRAELGLRMIVPYFLIGFLFVLGMVSVPYPFALLFKAPFLFRLEIILCNRSLIKMLPALFLHCILFAHVE